ncbi:adenylate/guanylate cyclase domain-containing protein [Pikeienuella piscinae]|uniref:Adenylate/guanylate cyclase domain-containing protein n=1 Tax=Pikeienuella piscinae TaxID=2748098 RepID=A0A7L5C088_9RHOB|nr:adenylate/guanylate cyclase domain-containing protein [Pikeienuella piscinae]QIE55279.1 adenylate/guanylate cyclase domain-containing protein [Pikeienuella piscinae]
MAHDGLIEEIESWLIDRSLGDPDIEQLFQTLCVRLAGVGLPLDRAALTWPTLHPLFQAEQIFWNPTDGAKLLQYSHANQATEGWLKSPFFHVLTNGLDRLRRRLTGPESLLDFDVLKELRDQGFTDYLMTAAEFRIGEVEEFAKRGTGIIASWATKRESGFTRADLEALSRIQRIFAVACRVAIQRRVTANLVNAYLGPTAGWKALSGEIRRGDGETIRAVVYYADLRGSTTLSDAMEPDEYLALLRRYFDCAAQPVIDEGGEILDYVGDAVLAIFPIQGETGGPEAVRAATRAMERALVLRAETTVAAPDPEMRFSISLAAGEVMFGNIGVPTRLSFSVIGAVVNEVARMDDASKSLGRAVLATRDIASVEPQNWVSLGMRELPGVSRPREIFVRKCELDAFDTSLAESA